MILEIISGTVIAAVIASAGVVGIQFASLRFYSEEALLKRAAKKANAIYRKAMANCPGCYDIDDLRKANNAALKSLEDYYQRSRTQAMAREKGVVEAKKQKARLDAVLAGKCDSYRISHSSTQVVG